jgi:hypothetical protein
MPAVIPQMSHRRAGSAAERRAEMASEHKKGAGLGAS